MKSNQGFTLIELMITIAILAVLAAIAYSSYTRYIVRSAETRVETKMQSLTMELDRFRASRLTYRGFVPRKVKSDGTEEYAYDDEDKITINATASNSPYTIKLVGTLSDEVKGLHDSIGNQWHMFAEPSDNAPSGTQYKYYMSSLGHRCRSKNEGFVMPADNAAVATICTEAGVETW